MGYISVMKGGHNYSYLKEGRHIFLALYINDMCIIYKTYNTSRNTLFEFSEAVSIVICTVII
jgi:hypothetical protein